MIVSGGILFGLKLPVACGLSDASALMHLASSFHPLPMPSSQMGDDFELHQYERKTALVCAEESLQGNYANVQAGELLQAIA